MKDIGYGTVIYLTAQHARVEVEEWDLKNWRAWAIVDMWTSELEGNGFPTDLTDTLALGQTIRVTVNGKANGHRLNVCKFELVPLPENGTLSEVLLLRGKVLVAHENGGVVGACLDDKNVKVTFGPTAFNRMAFTHGFQPLSEILKKGTAVVMKVVKEPRTSRNSTAAPASFVAISIYLAEDKEAFYVPPPEPHPGPGTTDAPAMYKLVECHSASSKRLTTTTATTTTTTGTTKAEKATQTAPLVEDALAAIRRIMSSKEASQQDMINLWKSCPSLVRMAFK